MPQIVLARSLTYLHHGTTFYRGRPQEVTEGDYLFLLTQGFIDPTQELEIIHPSRLARAPAGTEVPVIRTGGLGDVLMVLPGLRDLATLYPKLRFTYATSAHFVPVMRDCTFLYRAAPLGSLTGRYQWVIDLRGYSERNDRERFDRISVFAKYLLNGLDPSDWSYPLYPTREEILQGKLLTGALEHGRPTVGIVCGSHSQGGMRNWPIRYVEQMAELVYDHGMRPVLIDDKPVALTPRLSAACARPLAGHLSMPAFFNVMASLDYCVTPDTGALHLAEALGVRTVGYFTSIPPEARAVHYRYVRTLYAGVHCAPCYHSPTCGMPPGETLCAKEVTPKQAWAEIEWMAANPPPYHYKHRTVETGQPVQFAYAGGR